MTAQDRDRASPDPVAEPGPRPSTFESLHFVDFRRLFSVGVLVFIAVQAQQVARGQLAFELTGTNAGLGAVYLGFGLPMLIITPLGGVVADRLPKRTVMLCSQVCLVFPAGWIAVAGAVGELRYWMLIGASLIQGAGFSIFTPTRVAFTAELVPRRLIGNAVAVTQVSMNGTRVVAPAAAGALMAVDTVGTTGVYYMTTAALLGALLVGLWLPKGTRRDTGRSQTVGQELRDGVRYARRDPILSLLIRTSFVMVMMAWPYLAFLPAIANDMFAAGRIGLGLLSSVSAVAAVAVSLWIAGRARSAQAWRIQSTCGMLLAVGLLAMAAAPTFAFCLAAIFVIGGSASGYQAMNNTIVLMVSDLEYHGRVQSLLHLSFAGFGLIALPLGLVADQIGLRLTFLIMGSVCLGTMAWYTRACRVLARGGLHLETSPG